MHYVDLVGLIIQFFSSIQINENIYPVISLLSKLVLNNSDDKNFAHQFVTNDGLLLYQKLELLNSNNNNVILDSVNILSHLARVSKEFYEPIHRLNLYNQLKRLFKHSEPIIRSKTCNLLGNLCRHNPYFYEQLLKHSLIQSAIQCCFDNDSATRKFACFALGNAGFHNDKLYGELKPVVCRLIELLQDKEEKTRANAAGALGNFVRNSNALVMEMIKH